VEQRDQRRTRRSAWLGEPIKIPKITVLCVDPLALITDDRSPQEVGKYRLRMAAA